MMTPLDLDSVKETLAPLDISFLFAVVGGDHLFGTATPDSPIRVRACHREALLASLGPGKKPTTMELELVDHGISVRLLSEDADRIGRRIERGDGHLIEELASPHVIAGREEASKLFDLAHGMLTRRIQRHYRALARAALWRLEGEKTKRTRPILSLYRAVLAGTHVLETGEIVPDLPRLIEIFDADYLKEILPSEGGGEVVGEPARAGFLLQEAFDLMERMEAAANGTSLPEDPPDPAPLREYLAGFEVRE